MVVFFDNGGVHQTATIVLFHTQMEMGRGINFMYRYLDHVSSITVKKEWNQPFVSNKYKFIESDSKRSK